MISHSKILTESRSWRAMPSNYNSLLCLQFKTDWKAKLTFGHGQTIYAVILSDYEIESANVLTLRYLESPSYGHFKGFTPSVANEPKRLTYELNEGSYACEEANVGPHEFRWRLALSEWPFPNGLDLPYVVPAVFFGHDQKQRPGVGVA